MINNEDTIKVKPSKFILNDRVVWIWIICLGKLIILEILNELTEKDGLMEIKDHTDKSHVIIWAKINVEWWSSKEEKNARLYYA